MLVLRGPVSRCSSMIVVVGRYPTIPLEMSTRLVYGPLMDSPACGIVWKTCWSDLSICHIGLIYTPAGLVIDLDLRDTLRYE
jgi:hypothetical protein